MLCFDKKIAVFARAPEVDLRAHRESIYALDYFSSKYIS